MSKEKFMAVCPALWFKNFIKDFGKFPVVPFHYPDCIFLGFDDFFLFLDLRFQRGDKPVTAGKSFPVIWLHIPAPLSEKSITESMTSIRVGADCIVTRNLKDYRLTALSVFSPEEFLEKLMEEHTNDE